MGQAKPIIWDAKFDLRPTRDQIDYLKKLCSSQNHALDLMQKERNELLLKDTFNKAQLGNCQQALDIQKNVVTNLITQTNAESQGIAEKIQALEIRVRAQDALIKELNGD